jgi:tRNA(Arg) A34 adenosine deaminase TadA
MRECRSPVEPPSLERALPELLRLANSAFEGNLPPFSAVIVDSAGVIKAQAISNQTNEGFDSFGHAETATLLGDESFSDAADRHRYWMVSTAEPCPFCASAIVNFGLGGAVFIISQEWISALRGYSRYHQGKSSADASLLVPNAQTAFTRITGPAGVEGTKVLEELFHRYYRRSAS